MNELFYNKEITEKDEEFYLNNDESKHLIKSLRKKVGDILIFTNGKGFKFDTRLEKFDSRISKFSILNNRKIKS